MKKVITLFLSLFLLLSVGITAFADTENSRVVDNADLLTETEEESLTAYIDSIVEKQSFDIVVLTVNTLDGKTPMDYADDYYDYNGYGIGDNRDGCLLLISMEDRDWWISTRGFGITALTDFGIQYLGNELVSYISDGYYYNGFSAFVSSVDDFVSEAKLGMAYDVDRTAGLKDIYMPDTSSSSSKQSIGKSVAVSLIVALVIALIITGSVKKSYKPVKFNRSAANYLVSGSLNVTGSYDNFLYSSVSQRRIERDSSSGGGSSTHSSSSGASHGGGGGKF